MTVIERIKAGLESDTPGRVEWRSLLETALFEIERLQERELELLGAIQGERRLREELGDALAKATGRKLS